MWCLTQDRLGFFTFRQATFMTALISLVFDSMMFTHEIALEGGFDVKNYVAVAFCIVWLIVTLLLLLGTYKKAQFLLLPWMILICMLTPLFIVGIVAGCKMIKTCSKEHLPDACAHEYHIFGTRDPTAATAKLALLIFMLVVNSGSILVVYKYFVLLNETDGTTSKEIRSRPKDNAGSIRYKRFASDESDMETNMPLCYSEQCDETKETVT